MLPWPAFCASQTLTVTGNVAAAAAISFQSVIKRIQVFRAEISWRIMIRRGIKMVFTGSPCLVGVVLAEHLFCLLGFQILRSRSALTCLVDLSIFFLKYL